METLIASALFIYIPPAHTVTAAAAPRHGRVGVVIAAALMMPVVVVTAAALMMPVMVATAAALMMMFPVVVMLMLPGVDFSSGFHRPGDFCQLGQQGIRIRCGEPQLAGSEGDGGLLHFREVIEFRFNLGGAVGTIQVFDDVYLSGHEKTY